MQYWDSKGRLHDTEDKGKISLGQNLANQARAGLTNLNSWLNESNPNSEAYKQKMDTALALETFPLGIGNVATKAIATKLMPYVGRKLAQMTAEGIGGGAVGGLVEGALDSGLHNENIIQGALKGSAMGATAGGLGGYGLGKIGQGLARKGVSKSTENATQYFNDYIDDLADKSKVMNDFRGLKAGVSGQGNISYDTNPDWNGDLSLVTYDEKPFRETGLGKLKYGGILDSLLKDGKTEALNTLENVKLRSEKNLQGDSNLLRRSAQKFLDNYDDYLQKINNLDENKIKFAEPQRVETQNFVEQILETPVEKTEVQNVFNPEIEELAKKYFGVTGNRKEAGYILNDGSLLDLSGKKMGGKAGTRGLDHREIVDAFLDNPDNVNNLEVGFDEFIDNGAVRYMPESDSFFLAKKPSEAQTQAIKDLLNYTNGKGNFELVPRVSDWGNDNNFRKDYAMWSNPNKIIEDINTYYNGGTISPFRDYR